MRLKVLLSSLINGREDSCVMWACKCCNICGHLKKIRCVVMKNTCCLFILISFPVQSISRKWNRNKQTETCRKKVISTPFSNRFIKRRTTAQVITHQQSALCFERKSRDALMLLVVVFHRRPVTSLQLQAALQGLRLLQCSAGRCRILQHIAVQISSLHQHLYCCCTCSKNFCQSFRAFSIFIGFGHFKRKVHLLQ